MMPDAYLAFLLAGPVVGVGYFMFACRAAGIRLGRRGCAAVGAIVACGFVGARLHALVERGWDWELATRVDGGFRLAGGIVGMLVGFALVRPVLVSAEDLRRVADIGAIAAQFGLAAVRLGCLAAGCCFGTVSDLPWAIQFPRGSSAALVHAQLGLIGPEAAASLRVHPLQLYFLLLHVTVGLFLVWFARRTHYDGQLVLLGVFLGEGGKALLERFRQPIPGAPDPHLQAVSLALAGAAAGAMVGVAILRRRRVATRAAAAACV